MNPRTLVLTSLLAALPAGAALAAESRAPSQKPNVLFIAVDDLRVSLGCYGDPLAKSPNIDRLASQARVFTRAYTMQAVCGPARTAIMTGRLPDQTRVWHNRNLFRDTHPDTVTLPQLFKQHGYHAQGLGKTFSGDEREEDPASWSVPATLKAEGWKNYVLPRSEGSGKQAPYEAADVPDDGYTDGKLANLAVETLGKLKQQGKPFFLAVGFFKPHLPFNAPKKYWDLHDPAKFDLPGESERVQGAPDAAYHSHRELGGYIGMPKDERLDAAQTRTLRHGYYACVSYTDAQIGKVLAALDRHNLAGNTIVVLWGDHGYALGDAGRWCKGTNFELDARVPFLVRTPGLAQPGRPTSSLIEYVDIYPTLAELAGLPAPAYLAGRSFTPILRDPAQPGREFALSQFARPFNPGAPQAMGYTIRTATHRYTRWVDWPARQTTAEELYDYTAPASAQPRWTTFVERRNVLADPAYAAVRDDLRGKMDQVLRERSVVAPARPPAAGEGSAAPKKKKKRQE
ncbi:MAG: sulfatase [Verrucomicrobia bacterium]|nr:sulfatase [Verrucomicrobiota bacterium]